LPELTRTWAARLLLTAALLLATIASGAAQQPNAPGLGDSFNTNTAPPLSGGVEETDPVRCFDHALRDEQNALQAYQVIYGRNWQDDFACRGQVAAADLDPCWNLLLQVRPLIEEAARDYQQARRVPDPQSGQLVHAGNDVMRQAAGIWQQARACFNPIFARWTQNGGRYVPRDLAPPSPSQGGPQPSASLPAQCGGAPGYATWDAAGHVTLHCGAAANAPSEDCDPSVAPDIRQELMNAAAQMDRIATDLQNRAMAASTHMIQGMAEVLSADLQFLAQTAQHPVETARQVATAIVDYLTTDYNVNNERLYDAAVQAVDEWQRDPAHALGKTVANVGVGAASGAAGALVGTGVRACAAGAQKALKRAADIAKAKRAAAALEHIATIAKVPEEAVPPPSLQSSPAPIPKNTLRALSQKLAQEWENDVFRYLQIGNKGNVGRQITLKVYNAARQATETIRIDDLVRNPGASYTLNDAKFTAPLGRYLTTADLEDTLTESQLAVADWMKSGDPLVFTPTGDNARAFGLTPNQPIPVDPVFHIYVQTPDGVPMLRKYP
jgi:hypothetical protein